MTEPKKKWVKPEIRTLGTPAEIEERGRLKGIDQCIAKIRAGVTARRTRAEYGERFVSELEALKTERPLTFSEQWVKAITGQPKTVVSVPVAEYRDTLERIRQHGIEAARKSFPSKSHLTMGDMLGMRDSAARGFAAAADNMKPFPRLLTDRELLALQGAPDLWKDVGPSLPPADVIFESPPCKSYSGRTLPLEPSCLDCGMPESVHADAGGSRGLDGCQRFRR